MLNIVILQVVPRMISLNYVCYTIIYDRSFYLIVVLTVERPTRCAVLVQLSSINASWRSIGNGLGVSYNDLQGLAQRNDSDQTRLDHVIEKWFKMNGEGEGAPVIWKTIIEVVKGPLIQDKALAMTIYESLKRENSVQQNTQSKYVILSLQLEGVVFD